MPGLMLKILNLTQQKQITQEQNGKKTKSKPKSKEHLNLKHQSTLRTARVCVCVYHCVQLSYTIQHRVILTIFHLILHTVIIAQMSST